ncbi:TP53-regulated inhibitor of apoptosis 1 [Petromyzon marinus]|uniref:TP53-regulated inhibitor of apoptosis 1 n=1 Tax=Petromyzon marinus TaxID=7757 RepID=UPI003F70C4C8
MDSIGEGCTELKRAYDRCFNSWFSERFLKGEHRSGADPCAEIFKGYQTCLKKAIKEQNIPLDGLEFMAGDEESNDSSES